MYYSISGLCPTKSMAGCGFTVRLYPKWRELVAQSDMDQSGANRIVEIEGRRWLDACGYDEIFDPDNCGAFAEKNAPPGPRAVPLYRPNEGLRVSWGDWGPQHICVPGNACGLDIDIDAASAPVGGAALLPHNVDCIEQAHLLLVVFTHFADYLSMHAETRRGSDEG